MRVNRPAPCLALLLVLGLAVGSCGGGGSTPPPDPTWQAKDTLLGSAVSPAHFPDFTDQDLEDYFTKAAAIGSHVVFIEEWVDEVPESFVSILMAKAAARGLAFHLYLSPIEISADRNAPAIPPSVTGTSFGDAPVREAFKAKALALAALAPDLLGLGTEVNFLAADAAEFPLYVSLFQETVAAVHAQYPSQLCTVSFQWDRMILPPQDFSALITFRDLATGAPQVFAFTTYPDLFGQASLMPAEYYSSVRLLLPTQELGFSEVGWSGFDDATRAAQADFWTRIPALMNGASPGFVSMSLMHDVTLFTGALAPLNHTGVRYVDGIPKPAWDVVNALVF
jgi:hypothetical protein